MILMHKRLACVSVLAAFVIAMATACGRHPELVGGDPTQDIDAATSSDGDAQTGFALEGGSGDAGGCPNHCSTDLHTLRDCHEGVLLTCPDDKGCANDTCIDPCGAARVNGSAQGCEFYSAEPAMFENGDETDRGACFTVMLASTYVSSATLLIPTSAWGRNFVAVDAYPAIGGNTNPTTGPFLQIVAAEDDTHVSIDPVVAIVGGTNVEPSAAHAPHTYTLAHGEILQL